MSATPPVLVTLGVVALGVAPPTAAYAAVSIHEYSQATSESTAQAGASINVSYRSPGSTGGERGTPASSPVAAPQSGLTEPPTSSSPSPSSPRLTPCFVAQEGLVTPCFGVVPGRVPNPRRGGASRQPPVNPAVLAAMAASQLALSAGAIQASPSRQVSGLTGAASWFWLSPSPSPESVSASAGNERVTVTASPSTVRWAFGDGSELAGGAGIPYRAGSGSSGAVLHTYKTRCLPGDRGHDPYVLASCGADGYTVRGLVQWAISYRASGPIVAAGALPARSTATSTSYPVSEARAFLTTGSGR